MRLRASLPVLAALTCIPAGACAPAATAGDGAAQEAAAANRIEVQVSNTVVPPTSLTIYSLEQGSGSRRILGNVSPNGRANLSFNPSITTGTYRLMGRTTAGQELFSTPFTASVGQTVVWDVQINSLRVL